MTDLRPETRAFLARVRDEDDPSPADAARVRARIALRLGAGAAIGAATAVSAKASAAGVGTSAATLGPAAGAGAGGATLVSGAGAGALATKIVLAVALSAGAAFAVHEATCPTETSSGVHVVRGASSAPGNGASAAASTAVVSSAASTSVALSAVTASVSSGSPVGSSSSASARVQPSTSAFASGKESATGRPASGPATPMVRSLPAIDAGAPVSASRDSAGDDALATEARLLGDAERALSEGDPSTALARLDAHARRFPAGALEEDRAALRVHAFCMMGRVAEARAAAQTFVAAHRGSAHVARVATACTDAAAPGRPSGGTTGN